MKLPFDAISTSAFIALTFVRPALAANDPPSLSRRVIDFLSGTLHDPYVSRGLGTQPWFNVTDLTTPGVVAGQGKRNLEKRGEGERVTCYDTGTEADRNPIVTSIDDFCGKFIGTHVDAGQTISYRYDWGTFTVLVSGTAINDCSWTVDENCNRLLRRPVDECNTDGENGKQGGFVTDICGSWRLDPGANGDDF